MEEDMTATTLEPVSSLQNMTALRNSKEELRKSLSHRPNRVSINQQLKEKLREFKPSKGISAGRKKGYQIARRYINEFRSAERKKIECREKDCVCEKAQYSLRVTTPRKEAPIMLKSFKEDNEPQQVYRLRRVAPDDYETLLENRKLRSQSQPHKLYLTPQNKIGGIEEHCYRHPLQATHDTRDSKEEIFDESFYRKIDEFKDSLSIFHLSDDEKSTSQHSRGVHNRFHHSPEASNVIHWTKQERSQPKTTRSSLQRIKFDLGVNSSRRPPPVLMVNEKLPYYTHFKKTKKLVLPAEDVEKLPKMWLPRSTTSKKSRPLLQSGNQIPNPPGLTPVIKRSRSTQPRIPRRSKVSSLVPVFQNPETARKVKKNLNVVAQYMPYIKFKVVKPSGSKKA